MGFPRARRLSIQAKTLPLPRPTGLPDGLKGSAEFNSIGVSFAEKGPDPRGGTAWCCIGWLSSIRPGQATRQFMQGLQAPMTVAVSSAANRTLTLGFDPVGTVVAPNSVDHRRGPAQGAEVQKRYPELTFKTVYDQSAFVTQAVHSLEEAAVLGGLLAMRVVFFFLRWWSVPPSRSRSSPPSASCGSLAGRSTR